MNLRLFAAATIAAATIAAPTLAWADDDELDSGRVVAVEPRPYALVHEFALSAGILPADAFYTGLSLGGSYTLHFSDLWAWEALSFHYSGNVDTGLEKRLGERWSAGPTGDAEFRYLVGSNAVFAPLFGKFTLFNSAIITASTYLALGGGFARYTDGFRPQVSVGPGLRIFFGQVLSTRFDIRNVIVPDQPEGLEYVLHFTFSIAFNFGSQRATESEVTAEDPDRGFKALDELYPDPTAPREEDR